MKRVSRNTILKLILQPLVENALYHGIKNKRCGGTIVRAAPTRIQTAIYGLRLKTTGSVLQPTSWPAVRAKIDEGSDNSGLENGFGIDNVNERIQLYYGRQYGLYCSERVSGRNVRGVCYSCQDRRGRRKVTYLLPKEITPFRAASGAALRQDAINPHPLRSLTRFGLVL